MKRERGAWGDDVVHSGPTSRLLASKASGPWMPPGFISETGSGDLAYRTGAIRTLAAA
jgi:hypothetical protein